MNLDILIKEIPTLTIYLITRLFKFFRTKKILLKFALIFKK